MFRRFALSMGCVAACSAVALTACNNNAPVTVLSTSPADGATAVPVSAQITIQFSRACRRDSLDLGISPDTAAQTTWTQDSQTASIAPEAPLAPGTVYNIVVRAVSGAGGGNLETLYSSSFTTAASVTTAPELHLVEVPDALSPDNPVWSLPSAPAPGPGDMVENTDFGTTQRRVTATLGLRHEYAKFDPFNASQSLVLLMYIPDGAWRVYRTASVPYDTAAQLTATVDLEEPRWDPVDPNMLWGTRDFQIVKVDVRHPGQPETVKDFAQDSTIKPILDAHPDLYHITMNNEGKSSTDKRYWAFSLQGSQDNYRARYLFTWDRVSDTVPGMHPLPLGQSNIDWVGMSPKGNWVLIGGLDDNAAPLTGLTMANRELTQFHRLDFSTAHADVGLDVNGTEVVVMQNVRTDHVDLIPIDTGTQPIIGIDGSYAGTNRTPLIRLYYAGSDSNGLNSGIHLSCNHPGYCVVSTAIDQGLPAQNWLDRKIVITKLDPTHPRTFYLAQVYGTRGEYWEETQATIANNGAKVVWATNWSKDVGQIPERVWDMQTVLPEGWVIP